jgi:hypothetical protein
VNTEGHLRYVDPATGEVKTEGTETPADLTDTDNPARPQESFTPTQYPVPGAQGEKAGAPHYETDDQGNVTEFVGGKAVPLGKHGKTTVHPPRQDPAEAAASRAGESAMAKVLALDPTDEEGAQRAYRVAFAGARQATLDSRAGTLKVPPKKLPPPPPGMKPIGKPHA